MTELTKKPLRDFSTHIASQGHAMAGATIAASAALACSLGEACVQISASHLTQADAQEEAARTGARLAQIHATLLALADEDGAAITAFAALREAGQELQGQQRLCQMPVEIGKLAIEAASLLQYFRPHVRHVQDDLEMAITLLAGAARAASLLLDSNLRLWPELELLGAFEPLLAELREQLDRVQPVERIR